MVQMHMSSGHLNILIVKEKLKQLLWIWKKRVMVSFLCTLEPMNSRIVAVVMSRFGHRICPGR
jgi:hypothetical protein